MPPVLHLAGSAVERVLRRPLPALRRGLPGGTADPALHGHDRLRDARRAVAVPRRPVPDGDRGGAVACACSAAVRHIVAAADRRGRPADVLPARHDDLPRVVRRCSASRTSATRPTSWRWGPTRPRRKAVVAAAGRRRARRAAGPPRRASAGCRCPPVVVKPADADNSLGVALVRDPAEYAAALVEAVRALRPGARGAVRRAGPRGPLRRRSSATASWSACRWRSTPSTGTTSPSATTPTRSRGPTAAGWRWSPRTTPARGSSTPPTRSRRRSGRRRAAATGRWAAGTTACSTSASTPTAGPGSSRPASTARSPGRASSAIWPAAAGIALAELFRTGVERALTRR